MSNYGVSIPINLEFSLQSWPLRVWPVFYLTLLVVAEDLHSIPSKLIPKTSKRMLLQKSSKAGLQIRLWLWVLTTVLESLFSLHNNLHYFAYSRFRIKIKIP